MKVVTRVYYNSKLAKLILFKGYSTIMLFGSVFTKESSLPPEVLNEEMIHARQYKDCITLGLLFDVVLVFGFLRYPCYPTVWLILLVPLVFYYAMYFFEWLISFIHHFFSKKRKDVAEANEKAYHASAMEMEAKENRDNLKYLQTRHFCAFFKYYGKL